MNILKKNKLLHHHILKIEIILLHLQSYLLKAPSGRCLDLDVLKWVVLKKFGINSL